MALCQHKRELVLLINPIVQLIQGAIKLTTSVKYFPFHIKLFELLNMINEMTDEFIPIAQYLLYPFESTGGIKYLNSKSKPSEDKMLPETLVSLKIAKKHLDTIEMKDRVVVESLEQLTLYLATFSRSLFYPELTVALTVVLRRFRKDCSNANYKKLIQSFLLAIDHNSSTIVQKRNLLKQKQLKSTKVQHVEAMLRKTIGKVPLSMEKERNKILKKRIQKDEMKNKPILDTLGEDGNKVSRRERRSKTKKNKKEAA